MANITFRADGSILHNGVELGVFRNVTVSAFGTRVVVAGPGINMEVYPASDTIVTPAGAFAGTAAQLQAILQNQAFLDKNNLRQLFSNNAQAPNPGNGSTTTENNVAAYGFTIPANSLGVNGRLIIEGIIGWTGTGSHTIRHKIGGVTVFTIGPTTNTSYHYRVQVRNRNSLTSQIIASLNSTPGAEDRGSNATAFIAGTINFGIDNAFVSTLQNATGTDTSFIEALNVTAIG